MIMVLTILATLIALPSELPLKFNVLGRQVDMVIGSPKLNFSFFGRPVAKEFILKQGLDIQGGMQVVLQADHAEGPGGGGLPAGRPPKRSGGRGGG